MRRVLPLLLGLLVLAGCSTSKDAVATGAQEFTFVAPGGQTTILYDPPSSRGVAPNLSGDSLMNEGAQVGLDDYAGRVVVVNIWGSWCGPCRTEAPDLQFVADQTKDLGVSVLGIDVRDDRDAARDFKADRGLTFDSIFDPASRSLAALDGYPRNVVPSTLVLDRQHRVAAVYLTVIRPSDLLSTVQRVAAEPAA
ncbi:TlpA family protein disulfide reductase [Pseudonocardia oroxyli]|uniref:Thiol-disulfide isomerase or thioredoxin n=1 Tax=Pseudonocardia oroxyli TaxID=366584 RepID=A0A1G7G071_PSEOR|nr:TlpA disulfide reductase family protein [Pseudonocardia oroxyli]SDE81546.1 Thiol-disulfide isomerase or thioredoxin [Pseudonocardia oroxyli]